ncbi:MAG: cyclic nucleotide-binding domain-containing protein [Gallionellaceae bacterium]|nr:cyclic nucleotide-binding domain-containing protein [Gallionellaceae bacterium]
MPFFDLFKHDTDLVEVSAGKTLFCQGDDGDVMYVLVDGEAEIFIGGMVLEKCVPGALVGEIAVIENAPRSATVKAITPCRFASIDRKRFNYLVDEIPGFAIAVMRVMAQRLGRCNLRVIQSS